jgi:Glycosyl hydrolase family 99
MPAEVSHAMLRVFARSGSRAGLTVRWLGGATSWSERRVPRGARRLGPVIGRSGRLSSRRWASIDVTAAIGGAQPIELVLTSARSRVLRIASRESGRPPRLVVEGAGAPQPGAPAPPAVQSVPVAPAADPPPLAPTPEPTPEPTPAPTPTPTPEPTPPPDPAKEVSFPARGAFYYPWFPETWTVGGVQVFYHPTPLGYYDSSDPAVADAHIRSLDHGKIDVAILSWWGAGEHAENTRVPMLMDRTTALGKAVKWAAYYEKEGFGDPPTATLSSDLWYLRLQYAARPEYATVGGKPVIFVYNADDTTCSVADRWAEAARGEWYVVLKVFPGYRACASQPNAWHQYGPASAVHQHEQSYVISPGFWRADEVAPRLARDPATWRQQVRDMVASGKPWQLVTTFNEWGEGTAVEAAQEWESPSGYGSYLDALHDDGG